MTTTYELYTNENGTPKLVEGKAPAIIERVETLETDVKTLDGDIKTLDEDVGNIQTAIEVLEGGVVKTINGETPDQAGNIDIPVGHNVGEEWVSYTGKIPNGGVPYCGQTVTRATYTDLWAYAQAQGLVKTESEWQSWSSSHGGNVPFYSSGDGSSTFRMPSIKGYVKGASSQSESGSYVKEGLPNITGSIPVGVTSYDSTNVLTAYSSASGALSATSNTTKTNRLGSGTASLCPILNLDASDSNSIYGNSSHVTPETSVVLFGVYAFGEITNTGALDATTLAKGLATVESNLEAKLDDGDKAKIVGWGMPDYSAGVTKSKDTIYTATKDVFVIAKNDGNYTYATSRLFIYASNGTELINFSNSGYGGGGSNEYGTVSAFIPKGFQYKVIFATGKTQTIVEYPLKGA